MHRGAEIAPETAVFVKLGPLSRAPVMSVDSPLKPATPQSLGRYELLAAVARGGMGQVWAGRLRGARGFNKLVAIKTLLHQPGAEGRLESMLLEEARIAALIHHPNVVQTLELGEHESTLYLVMEWVDGESLSFVMNRAEERRGIPLLIAVNLVGQTLLGLHAAHELSDEKGSLLGVVHRDVSPHNVLITYSGVAKLVDFGIAKATNQQQTSSTEAGEVKGKFSYMAPEQIRCEEVDRRADVFAAGIMLYTLTAGRHPFKSQHLAGVVQKITSDEPAPRPSLIVPGYSRTLESVVMKALEKTAASRWSSAQEMLLALRNALPDAFAPGMDVQVKAFIGALMGDRATLRREELHRAQLLADSRIQSSASLAALKPGSSESASSLQALSIDEPAPAKESQSGSAPLTLPAPAKRSRVSLWVALGAIALFASGYLVSRGFSGTPSAASPPQAGMVELPRPAASPAVSVKALAEAPLLPATTPGPPSASAGPESSGPDAAVASSAATPPARRAVAPAGRSSVKQTKNRDLIAPDYAR
jgi:serine/threonine-protein kinase